MKSKKKPKIVQGLYTGGDEKHGKPVYFITVEEWTSYYKKEVANDVSWKLEKVITTNGVYVGRPGFSKDERDNLVLYKFQPKGNDVCSPKKKKQKTRGRST